MLLFALTRRTITRIFSDTCSIDFLNRISLRETRFDFRANPGKKKKGGEREMKRALNLSGKFKQRNWLNRDVENMAEFYAKLWPKPTKANER